MTDIPLSNNEGKIHAKEFPLDIFPKELQEIISMYSSILNISKEYSAVTILFAIASSMGSSYHLKIKNGWTELPTLFIAMVGKPGINKSAPISIFTKPLESVNKIFFDKFLDEYKAYKKARQNKEQDINNLQEPVLKQVVIKDTTQEALLQALYNNPHGLAGIYDELGAFLKSFNKYKPQGGGDEEIMLSLFSGKSFSINRKNTEPLLISHPFYSMLGGIQPQVLINLLGNNRIDNGLTHRFLFCFPDNIKREDLPENDITPETEELYDLLIKSILKPKEILEGNHTSRKMILSKEAMNVYRNFRKKINETINNEKSDAISGIYAKLDTYFLRLSLVVHIMRIACEEDISHMEVSACSASRAEKLIDYFEYMALKVFKLMERYRDPLTDYPQEHKILYYQLPNQFTTNQAWEIAKNKISRRTLFNMLTDDYLFSKLKHGIYEKIW
jgi:hypothetical protein